MTQQQKDFLLAQQDRIRAAQQQQPQQPLPPRLPPSVQNAAATTSHLPSSPKAPSPGRPQAGARPPQTLAEQRRQFLSSLASFHKQYNLSLPREIFNREKDGAVKVGDSRVEMLDLFMLVMKNQGIANVSLFPSNMGRTQEFAGGEAIAGQSPVAELFEGEPGPQSPCRSDPSAATA